MYCFKKTQGERDTLYGIKIILVSFKEKNPNRILENDEYSDYDYLSTVLEK